MSNRHHAPDSLRIDLAHALGFPDYPMNGSGAEPYLNYITNRFVGRNTREGYMKLVIHVIQHFQAGNEDASPPVSIQELLDSLAASSNEYFTDTKAGSQTRRDDVEDTVLYVIGVWTLLLSSFVHLPVAGGARKVALAYGIRTQGAPTGSRYHPYEENLAGLIRGSGLLPVAGQWGLPESSDDDDARTKAAVELIAMLREPQRSSIQPTPSFKSSNSSLYKSEPEGCPQSRMSTRFLDDLDSLESLHVAATRLNAYTLSVFGAVDVAWTHNISRHLLLSRRGGRHVLEVFALPCALSASTLTSGVVGITPEYAQEVRESYCVLFNAWSETPRHAKFGKLIGLKRFCWCWYCSVQRYRNQVVSRYREFSQKRSPGAKRSRAAHASEDDPLLIELMRNEPSDWTPDLFPSLWPRITILEEHLQAAKPWSIWILFRDRRDTLQFWTFLFATIVVMLTLVQVVLGIAQVVGSFK